MTAPVHQYSNEERRKRIFAIVGASSGNLVEWFDFYVYAFCAIYFAPAFFPSDNPTVQLLNTAGVFAAGFLMRPIGGWMFGRIADKHGRKTAMLISVVMMCAGSLAIACMPTYASIGTLAPALLLLARMFQGLSVGGEYGTSATYMSEVALKGQRGFFASFQYVTLIGGQLLAVLVVVTFTTYMQKYLVNTAGMSAKTASAVMTFALFAYMLMQPLFGMLSDRIGRKTSMLWFGTLGTLCTLPILLALKTVSSPYMAFFLIILALAIVSLYTSISGLIKAEMFPPEVRALGVGVSYAVGNAIFGGSAEYVALGLKSVGMENVFYWYVSAMCLLALLVCVSLPDLRKVSYLNDEP